jgi:pimeloyl-ACP methyl ester carboxylesterase
VVAVDLPGHGKSDKPLLDYDGPLFARAVRAAMDAEKIKRAVLVGHSMGTEIAGRLLHDAPDRVVALVSVDGVVMRTSPAGLKEWGTSMRGPSGVEVRRKFIERDVHAGHSAGFAQGDNH